MSLSVTLQIKPPRTTGVRDATLISFGMFETYAIKDGKSLTDVLTITYCADSIHYRLFKIKHVCKMLGIKNDTN